MLKKVHLKRSAGDQPRTGIKDSIEAIPWREARYVEQLGPDRVNGNVSVSFEFPCPPGGPLFVQMILPALPGKSGGEKDGIAMPDQAIHELAGA